jgi:homoserine O-acetyltransferase
LRKTLNNAITYKYGNESSLRDIVMSPSYTHRHVMLAKDTPLTLECGQLISDFPLAYETYGTLNADRSNAILVCHALTGDQYVTGVHPITERPGWWHRMIGPGLVVDTDKYFVICSNVLGGCMGSLGPLDINPETGKAYHMGFPVITIADMVEAQKLLIDYLGIEQLFCVMGGSMGGMQVLEWTAHYPKKVFSALPIASAARHSAQNIAFHEIGRQAIMADPHWDGGDYREHGHTPTKGLAVARMVSHITYQSEEVLHRKFGRSLQDADRLAYGFDADFQIESYLRHQGISFVDRFDANSYFYITRAANYFDLTASYGALHTAFAGIETRFCVISFTSDWLFPTEHSLEIVRVLNSVGANVSFVEVFTGCGILKGACMRSDFSVIADVVEEGSKVLDVGCANGELLLHLIKEKKVDGRGIDISQAKVSNCIAAGISAIQGDVDSELAYYPDQSFDYVISSQTLQVTKDAKDVLDAMLRLGKRVIISIPNFGNWRNRFYLGVKGRMPMTSTLSYAWYNTPNIHFCTVNDLIELATMLDAVLVDSVFLDRNDQVMSPTWQPIVNLLSEKAIFVLSRAVGE